MNGLLLAIKAFLMLFLLLGNDSFVAKWAWFADPYSTELVATTRSRDIPEYSVEQLLVLKAKHDHNLGK